MGRDLVQQPDRSREFLHQLRGGGPAGGVEDTWYYVVGTYDGSYIRAYVNGVEEAADPSTGTLTSHESGSTIGYWSGVATCHEGEMDEVRVSDIARSAAWIKASYDNQIDPTGFFTSYEEQGPPPGTIILLR